MLAKPARPAEHAKTLQIVFTRALLAEARQKTRSLLIKSLRIDLAFVPFPRERELFHGPPSVRRYLGDVRHIYTPSRHVNKRKEEGMCAPPSRREKQGPGRQRP